MSKILRIWWSSGTVVLTGPYPDDIKPYFILAKAKMGAGEDIEGEFYDRTTIPECNEGMQNSCAERGEDGR